MSSISHNSLNTTSTTQRVEGSNNNNNHDNSSSKNGGHAVSRSNELLSCAKTSWKLYQQQQQQIESTASASATLTPPVPPKFRLASSSDPAPPALVILEDGLTLLRSMEYGLQQLQLLVRRRGHTNDPTQEIVTLTQQLEQDTTELTEFCSSFIQLRERKQQQQRQRKRMSPQERKHWEYVIQWFQQVASHFSEQIKECLKLRGEILTEQAQQRRKLTSAAASNNNNNKTNIKIKKSTLGNGTKTPSTIRKTSNLRGVPSATSTPLFDSPLFQAPPKTTSHKQLQSSSYNSEVSVPSVQHPTPPPPYINGSNGSAASAAPTTTSSSSSTYYNNSGIYAGYGGVGHGGGYGGSGHTTSFHNNNYNTNNTSRASLGMRQRRGNTSSLTMPVQEQHQQQQELDQQNQEEEQKVHSQIQLRQHQRETQKRLEEARQAETMLGELGQMFGKMSTLISQQGETLEKIEDDIECALVDVQAGQEELTKLYGIKKGNRPLIIKTFAILNFLIIFMRVYYKKK
jgi:hypothetical protein